MNETKNIVSFIPQRPPFVMIDKILFSDETLTRTSFKIMESNIFVEGGTFKEPGLVENIAQTAAAREGYISLAANKAVKVGYIGAIKNLQINALPLTGDEIITEIKIDNQVFDVSMVSGKIMLGKKMIAQCDMKIFIINQ